MVSSVASLFFRSTFSLMHSSILTEIILLRLLHTSPRRLGRRFPLPPPRWTGLLPSPSRRRAVLICLSPGHALLPSSKQTSFDLPLQVLTPPVRNARSFSFEGDLASLFLGLMVYLFLQPRSRASPPRRGADSLRVLLGSDLFSTLLPLAPYSRRPKLVLLHFISFNPVIFCGSRKRRNLSACLCELFSHSRGKRPLFYLIGPYPCPSVGRLFPVRHLFFYSPTCFY